MRLEVAQRWTDAELHADLDLCLWEYKRVRLDPSSNDYAAWDIHYRKLHGEYERRGLLNEWNARIQRFRDEHRAATTTTRPA